MKKDNEKNEQDLMDKVNHTFDEMVQDVKSMVQDSTTKEE